jgi:hypothetical protein
MGRFTLFLLAAVGLTAALLTAVLLPVHLGAINPRVLEESRYQGKTLLQFSAENALARPAVSKITLHAAEELQLEGTAEVLEVLREGAELPPKTGTTMRVLERASAGRVQTQETPALVALRRKEDREQLAASFRSMDAMRILLNRRLTNLTLFAPVNSGAGYPLDASILTTAFLMEQRAFGANAGAESTLREDVLLLAARGISTNQVEALEECYLDMFALAKRFSSEQLIAFVSNVQSYRALDRLARILQEKPKAMPLIFSAVVLSRDGARVAKYLDAFPET